MKSKVFLYVLGEFVSKGLPLFALPLFVRLLPKSEYGELLYFISISAILSIFFVFGCNTLIQKAYFRNGRKAAYRLLAFHTISIITLLSFLIFFTYLYEPVLSLILFYAASQVYISLLLIIKQCEGDVHNYVFIQVLSSFLSLLITFLLILVIKPIAEYRLVAGIIANVFSSIILFKKLDIKASFFSSSLKLMRFYISYFLFMGGPLLFHQFAFAVRSQLDKVIVMKQYGSNELAVYGVSFQLASIYTILAMAVYRAYMPIFYTSIKEGEMTAKKVVIKATLFIPLGLLFSFFSFALPNEFFANLLGPDYVDVGLYTSLFLIAMMFYPSYLVLSGYLFYYGKNKDVAIINVISLFFLLCFWFLIYEKNLYYMALSGLSASVVMYIMLVLVTLRNRKNECK